MKNQTMPDYSAQSDAHTLVQAHQIKGDKARHGAAKKHMLTMAQEQRAKQAALAAAQAAPDVPMAAPPMAAITPKK